MEKYNVFGDRIKKARQKLGLNQADLAKQLNCTQAALSQYETGTREPSIRDLANIANRLCTSTDYLLGRTNIQNEEVSVRQIGDYLGLTEESIDILHKRYVNLKSKTDEKYILEEVEDFDGLKPGDEEFEISYNFVKGRQLQDLDDYTKALNHFLCSYEFSKLISDLIKNLNLERTIYDLLRVIVRKYDEIETCPFTKNIAEQAFSLASDSEDNIKEYLLNMFDIQNTITEFCQNFTNLEVIKKGEHKEQLYRKVVFYIYLATHDMFKNNCFSTDKMEQELNSLKETYGFFIEDLLIKHKEKKRA